MIVIFVGIWFDRGVVWFIVWLIKISILVLFGGEVLGLLLNMVVIILWNFVYIVIVFIVMFLGILWSLYCLIIVLLDSSRVNCCFIFFKGLGDVFGSIYWIFSLYDLVIDLFVVLWVGENEVLCFIMIWYVVVLSEVELEDVVIWYFVIVFCWLIVNVVIIVLVFLRVVVSGGYVLGLNNVVRLMCGFGFMGFGVVISFLLFVYIRKLVIV